MTKQEHAEMTLPKSSVLVPLYLYPLTEETWKPLHTAIQSHPQLQFVVILNPNSGPGAPPWWPDPGYIREIPQLNKHPNVSTLGYVRVDYCRRPLHEVLQDIDAYGRWAEDESHRGIYVRGIFFDETPNHDGVHAADYLEKASCAVRELAGIQGPRLVMHNPGTLPELFLVANSKPDVTAICEESLARYRSYSPQENLALGEWNRLKCCIILHTVPRRDIQAVVRELRQRASYLFVTELGPGSYYQEWGAGWDDFVRTMAETDP